MFVIRLLFGILSVFLKPTLHGYVTRAAAPNPSRLVCLTLCCAVWQFGNGPGSQSSQGLEAESSSVTFLELLWNPKELTFLKSQSCWFWRIFPDPGILYNHLCWALQEVSMLSAAKANVVWLSASFLGKDQVFKDLKDLHRFVWAMLGSR